MSVTRMSLFCDQIHLTVRLAGSQTNYLVHKSCALVAMDSRWLSDPAGHSQTAKFLKGQKTYAEPTAPRGYGYVVVDFDRKVIESYQSYKDVTNVLIDEFGYWGGASPTWMDWKAIVNDAFTNGCIREVIYQPDSRGKQKILKLPQLEQSRQTLALRFASNNKPIGHWTLGVGFNQPGWTMSHVPVPNNVVARRTVSQKMVERLRQLAITIAPDLQWSEFVKSY